MRAVTYEREGDAADVLIIGDMSAPTPGHGQVLVQIALSAINPSDVKARDGFTSRPIDKFQVPHMDGAGEIVDVGPGVDRNRVGQRVWLYLAAFQNCWGTAAEFVVIDQELAVPLPDAASAELGACLGIPAITAHECLFQAGPIKDRTVLVHGGAGAVGHYAIELARWAGANVIASASTEEKAEQARAAGATTVVNYRSPDAVQNVLDVGPVDLIVDVDIVHNWDLDLAVLSHGGLIASYATDGTPLTFPLRQAMQKGLRLMFFLLYTHPRQALAHAAEQINQSIADGALTPLPHSFYRLDEAVAAHEAVEAGTGGKVMLDLRDGGR